MFTKCHNDYIDNIFKIHKLLLVTGFISWNILESRPRNALAFGGGNQDNELAYRPFKQEVLSKAKIYAKLRSLFKNMKLKVK